MPVIRRAEVDDARVVAAIYVESWNRGFFRLMRSRSLTDTMVSRWEQGQSRQPQRRDSVALTGSTTCGDKRPSGDQ